MFYSIKKSSKNLDGRNKVHNFAPANETEVLPKRCPKRFNASGGVKVERIEKKVAKNFGNSKIGCNFAKPFGKEKSGAWPSAHDRTLKELQ